MSQLLISEHTHLIGGKEECVHYYDCCANITDTIVNIYLVIYHTSGYLFKLSMKLYSVVYIHLFG